MFSFGHCPNYLSPSFGQLVHLFRPSTINAQKKTFFLKEVFPYTVPQSKPLYCTSLAFTPTQIANEEDELGLWLCALMISVRGQWYLGVTVGLGLGVMVAKGNGAKLISWCDTIHPPEPRSHKKPLYKLFNFSSKWLIIIIMISALMTANCWTCWHGGGVEWWEALDSSSHPYQPNNHTIVNFAQIHMYEHICTNIHVHICTKIYETFYTNLLMYIGSLKQGATLKSVLSRSAYTVKSIL